MYWIQTYTGNRVDLQNPDPATIRIEDIAHALAMTCRFNGHTQEFYSVAQHSMIVSQFCREEDALIGLLHDAAEAYCGDVVRPLKRLVISFKMIEDRIMAAILVAFGLKTSREALERIKAIDDAVLATERRDLLGGPQRDLADWEPLPEPLSLRIRPWSPNGAYWCFLDKFRELGGICPHHLTSCREPALR